MVVCGEARQRSFGLGALAYGAPCVYSGDDLSKIVDFRAVNRLCMLLRCEFEICGIREARCRAHLAQPLSLCRGDTKALNRDWSSLSSEKQLRELGSLEIITSKRHFWTQALHQRFGWSNMVSPRSPTTVREALPAAEITRIRTAVHNVALSVLDAANSDREDPSFAAKRYGKNEW